MVSGTLSVGVNIDCSMQEFFEAQQNVDKTEDDTGE